MQKVIDSLNNCFPDLTIFTLAKLFSPKHYPLDDHDRGQLTETWLTRIVSHSQWDPELVGRCNAELLEFVETLASICQHKGMYETWAFCGSDREFMLNWLTLMSLWQYVLVIPTSTAIYEWDFSKQNWVKSERRSRLNLKTLDALMRASLNGLEIDAMDWNAIYEMWKVDTKTKKRRPLVL